MVDDLVCSSCGVAVAIARGDRAVHIGSIDERVEVHDATPVTRDVYNSSESPAAALALAASDMLNHHLTGHALADCQWAMNLREALRRA